MLLRINTALPVMRLTSWCKNIDQGCMRRFCKIFKPSMMRNLLNKGLLRPYTEGYGWRLSPDGYDWLASHGYPMQPASVHSWRTAVNWQRLEDICRHLPCRRGKGKTIRQQSGDGIPEDG